MKIPSLMILLLLAIPAALHGESGVQLVVLGNAQDGGVPHIGCEKACCQPAWADPAKRQFPTCLGLIDRTANQRWMVECTPDFAWQLQALNLVAPPSPANRAGLDGIVLTHAHIGHYAGLMLLGREALGATGVPVYAMPRMGEFLREHGPWSQLVSLNNIELKSLADGTPTALNARVKVVPLMVPHRDEFSETVGFRIIGPNRTALFIPDIDKWEHWEEQIEQAIEQCDLAFLDGTFFSADELPHRDMDEIPHPLIVESLKRFAKLPPAERDKIHFVHLNHPIPVLNPDSDATQQVLAAGMHVARTGMVFEL